MPYVSVQNEKQKNRIQARQVGFYLFWFLKEYFEENPEPTTMSNYPKRMHTTDACMHRNIHALKKLVDANEEKACSAWDFLSGAPRMAWRMHGGMFGNSRMHEHVCVAIQ